MAVHPVPDRPNPPVVWLQRSERRCRERQRAVRLAIAAGIQVSQHLGRRASDGHFLQQRRVASAMHQVDDHCVPEGQRAATRRSDTSARYSSRKLEKLRSVSTGPAAAQWPSRVIQFGSLGSQLSVGMPTFGSKDHVALSSQSALSSTGVKRQQRQDRSRRTRMGADPPSRASGDALLRTFAVPVRKKHLASPLSACSSYRIW